MTQGVKSFLVFTFPLVGWACLMLIVSSLPGDSLPQGGFWQWDKVAHTFEYMVLAILFYRYLVVARRVTFARATLLVAVVIPLFGVLDELHQLLIPFRSCGWQDMVADGLGALAAIAIMQNRFIRKVVTRG